MVKSESCSVVSDSLRPHDYTVHGLLQASILEWVAYPFSRGSSWPRNQNGVSCIAGRFFTNWAIRVWIPNQYKVCVILHFVYLSIYLSKIFSPAPASGLELQFSQSSRFHAVSWNSQNPVSPHPPPSLPLFHSNCIIQKALLRLRKHEFSVQIIA